MSMYAIQSALPSTFRGLWCVCVSVLPQDEPEKPGLGDWGIVGLENLGIGVLGIGRLGGWEIGTLRD